MKLSTEQYEIVKEYEDNLANAVYSNFCRCMPTVGMRKLIEIYQDVTGDKTPINTSCNHCVLAFLKKIGKIYFADKQERAQSVVEALDEIFDSVDDCGTEPPVKKAPAKAKSKNKATKKK